MQISLNIMNSVWQHKKHWRTEFPQRPYWRLYWNAESGAAIIGNDQEFPFTPDTITLIAPNTHFESKFYKPFRHFFIHFTYQEIFDTSKLSIHQIKDEKLIEELKMFFKSRQFGSVLKHANLTFLNKIIAVCLDHLPDDCVLEQMLGPHIQKAIDIMDQTLKNPISNNILAKKVGMSERSFLRHFKETMEIPPQFYYQQKRLEKAGIELEFSNKTIEEIAEEFGFCDRNYFSVVFKKQYLMTPVKYRRQTQS